MGDRTRLNTLQTDSAVVKVGTWWLFANPSVVAWTKIKLPAVASRDDFADPPQGPLEQRCHAKDRQVNVQCYGDSVRCTDGSLQSFLKLQVQARPEGLERDDQATRMLP